MSTSPPTPPAGSASASLCPSCGAALPERNGEPAKFCGQCGTTITSPPPAASALPTGAPPALYDRDVHEEVTVARELPDIAEYLSNRAKTQLGRTLMDPAPFGASAPRAEPLPSSSRNTPLVPAAEASSGIATPLATPAAAPRAGAAKTQMMAQTLNDPDVAQRARELRDAVLGVAATDPQAPPAAEAPKANLHRTMVMGGEPVPLPPPAAAPPAAAPPAAAPP
ncbi:MAG TPA: zinc ribbon domain-containing protein, partial [Labilithrix sp.]|nr:zinc ribbon domain-containing protein [Labilithrix sp.]